MKSMDDRNTSGRPVTNYYKVMNDQDNDSTTRFIFIRQKFEDFTCKLISTLCGRNHHQCCPLVSHDKHLLSDARGQH